MPPEWAVHPSYTRYAEAMSSTHRTRTAIQPPGMSFLGHQRALVSPIAASLASDLNALEAQGLPAPSAPWWNSGQAWLRIGDGVPIWATEDAHDQQLCSRQLRLRLRFHAPALARGARRPSRCAGD